MIVVIGRITTDADRRAELLRVAQEGAEASRKDPGCISYRFYEDTEIENEFVFVEEWENQDALKAHFATAHIATFMSAMPALLTSAPDVKFHAVASTADLSDMS